MKWNLLSVLGLILSGSIALGYETAPDCIANGQVLPINNEQVLQWKKQTQNQYKNRGHILGTVTNIYPGRASHQHFQVKIGTGPRDTIELIYNVKFREIDNLRIGAEVESCGDYITSKAKAGHYKPSPDGAILHWIHQSTNSRHESGYVMMDGVLHGMPYGREFYEWEMPWEPAFDSMIPAQ
ncbi:DUF3465 domain-containing protein [Bdellovibrio sp. HCB274]|uniref:DUF3465 domain-containing protein n=1 Tax=Bdellovibrio sp. HCB274 TaxID=3394361 RepID=UPI0039B417C8